MRKIALALLLVAACGKKGPDPEIARLNGVIEGLRKEMADDRAEHEMELQALRLQVAQAQAERVAAADALQQRLDELRAASEAQVRALDAKAKEAADALAKALDLEKRLLGADAKLADAKTALLKRTADLDAVKAELANLKKLLGR